MKIYLIIRPLLFSGIIAMLVTACYYDNEEYLYSGSGGNPTACDTSNVTYSGTVAQILNTYCNGCHNPGNPSAGIIVSNYSNLIIYVNNGRFLGSIEHGPGYSPMPKNGSKLSSCNLLKIKKWINDGALNN